MTRAVHLVEPRAAPASRVRQPQPRRRQSRSVRAVRSHARPAQIAIGSRTASTSDSGSNWRRFSLRAMNTCRVAAQPTISTTPRMPFSAVQMVASVVNAIACSATSAARSACASRASNAGNHDADDEVSEHRHSGGSAGSGGRFAAKSCCSLFTSGCVVPSAARICTPRTCSCRPAGKKRLLPLADVADRRPRPVQCSVPSATGGSNASARCVWNRYVVFVRRADMCRFQPDRRRSDR